MLGRSTSTHGRSKNKAVLRIVRCFFCPSSTLIYLCFFFVGHDVFLQHSHLRGALLFRRRSVSALFIVGVCIGMQIDGDTLTRTVPYAPLANINLEDTVYWWTANRFTNNVLFVLPISC